jgi:hypothetical protein
MQEFIDSENSFFALFAEPRDETDVPPDPAHHGVFAPEADGVFPPSAEGVSPPSADGIFWPEARGVFQPDAAGVFQPDADGVFPPDADGVFPAAAEDVLPAAASGMDVTGLTAAPRPVSPKRSPAPPWRASCASSSSSAPPAVHAEQPAGVRRGRVVDPETLEALREEQDAAEAVGMRWQDRGPVPEDPSERWRSQRWRPRTTTEDASVGRWGNRGGRHRFWYTTFYGLKGSKGMEAAAQAADDAIGKGSQKGQGPR